MSFLLPIVLAFTFMASSAFRDESIPGPVPPGVVVKTEIDKDRGCLAPCRLGDKESADCGCGRIKPKS